MAYYKFYPNAALQPYIFFYYVLEYEHSLEKPLDLQSLPKGLGGMVINYSDPYFTLNKKQEWKKAPDCFLAGQFTKKFTLRLQGKVGMIGVVFMPAAISQLFNIPMAAFTDQRIELSLVLGNQTQALTERIALANSHGERIKIIEQFLTKLFHKSRTQTDIVDQALRNIISQNGMISIENLSDQLCMSMRHFRRRFTEKIGISPKFYARIKRVNHITLLTESSPVAWSDIVYKAGYYDQAHFIHDLYNFSGKKPAEFIHYNQHLARLVGA